MRFNDFIFVDIFPLPHLECTVSMPSPVHNTEMERHDDGLVQERRNSITGVTSFLH